MRQAILGALFGTFMITISSLAGEGKADKIFAEYCKLFDADGQDHAMLYKLGRDMVTRPDGLTEPRDPTAIKKLEKSIKARSTKMQNLSMSHERIKKTYLSSGDCELLKARAQNPSGSFGVEKRKTFISTPDDLKKREVLQHTCVAARAVSIAKASLAYEKSGGDPNAIPSGPNPFAVQRLEANLTKAENNFNQWPPVYKQWFGKDFDSKDCPVNY